MNKQICTLRRFGALFAVLTLVFIRQALVCADSSVLHWGAGITASGWYYFPGDRWFYVEFQEDNGDIYRVNPDGTGWGRDGSPEAYFTIYGVGDNNQLVTEYEGMCAIQIFQTGVWVQDGDQWYLEWDGVEQKIHITGTVEGMKNGAKGGKLECQYIYRNGVLVLYTLTFAPEGLDFAIHK